MELLVIRHAIACARDARRWRNDAERPLSPAGIRRARKAATALPRLLSPPERVLTSPLLRARQTAAILTDIAGWPEAIECAALVPQAPPAALLRQLSEDRRVAVVGHQPGLGRLLALCLVGDAGLDIELKKNAIACLSFPAAPRMGRARLAWLITPRMLRCMR
ncbi:MAG TPA: histidine phosphatase family protein [Steroidobacteraceae bacterium]